MPPRLVCQHLVKLTISSLIYILKPVTLGVFDFKLLGAPLTFLFLSPAVRWLVKL